MSADRDPMTTLSVLRPRTSIDEAWPPAVRAAAYERVLRDGDAPTASATTAALTRRFRTLRIAAGGLAAGVTMFAGLGVASGAGVLPQDFIDTFAFWAQEDGVDLATAERAATAPGPDGLVFTVVTMSGPDDTVCVAPMFETPQSATGPVPSAFDGGGGSCRPATDTDPFGSNQGVLADADAHTYWVPAGQAVRAELRLPDGTTFPAVLVEGGFHGWFPTTSTGAAVLTGYAADGTMVGEVTITRLR